MVRGYLVLLFALLAPSLLAAQVSAGEAPAGQPLLRLFLDCSGVRCESDFYRTELAFVSHVRTPQDADVHLLVTRQSTGGGGDEYTLSFYGRRRFAGMADTVRYLSARTATEDERRRGLLRTIKLGLARYVARTPAAQGVEVSYDPPRPAARRRAVEDPWNAWTFRVRANGSFTGESRVSARSLTAGLAADRITEDWKIQISADGNDRRSRYEISDTQTVHSAQGSYGIEGLLVRSMATHWSAGVGVSASSSTRLNQDLHVRAASALEFSVYPYSEATSRQLTLLYSVGANHFEYQELTIFDRLQETRADHRILASLDLRQRWGSANVSLEGAQYLHDGSRLRGEMFGDLDVRLFRGLAANVFGSLSFVRDQLYLAAGDATTEEVLLQLRQLETDYRYRLSAGLSYSFGSIFNNVVNPRIGRRAIVVD